MVFFKSDITKIILQISCLIFSIILCILLFYIVLNNEQVECNESSHQEENIEVNETENTSSEIISSKIYIDIKGAVKNPGVYEIDSSSKVIDAINMAGGLKNTANTKYLNLSKKLSSETVLYIYTNTEINNYINEKNKEPIETCSCSTEVITTCVENKASIIEVGTDTIVESNSNGTESEEDAKVNINTADKDKLTSLSGIGESKAKSIIEYREKNGNFKSIEDIKNVSGISDSLYEKIKDYITI